MNSFRAVERAIAYEIERQAPDARRRRAAVDGDARLGRRPAVDLPHARQGDVRRLPLLPGAGPAAAPRRAGLDRAGPRRTLPELPAARRARYEALGLTALRRRGDRRRPGHDAARSRRSRRPAASLPAKEVANFVTGAHARVREGRRAQRRGHGRRVDAATGIAALLGGDRRRVASRGRSGRELLDAPPRRRARRADELLAAPGPARSPTTRRCSATSTRSSPPTRRPSRTTGPASRSPGSSSARS